jgi:hypothetical protein
MNAPVPNDICPAKPNKILSPSVVIVNIHTGIIIADKVNSYERPGIPNIGIAMYAKNSRMPIPILSSDSGKAANSSLYFDLN